MHVQTFIANAQQIFETALALFNLDILKLITAHPHLAYGIVFLGTFIEGETFVIFAGYYAHRDLFSLPLLVLWAALGSFAGDQLWFYLGRRYGHPLLGRYPRWQPGVTSALALAAKYSTGFILTFRFIYGIRNVSSFALGMSELAWLRFLVLNFIAALLWAASFACTGYLFGTASKAVLGTMAQNVGLAMLLVFVVVAAVLVRLQHRKKRSNGNGGKPTAADVAGVPDEAPAQSLAKSPADAVSDANVGGAERDGRP